jgi:hypothetical protein
MQTDAALADLRQQIAEINQLLEDVPHFVTRARLAGATWEQIGTALGVSRQAAHHRYSPYLPYEFPLGAET